MTELKLVTSRLGSVLKKKMQGAKAIYIITSFTMKSGVRVLKDAIFMAAEMGADIKILSGDYLHITQPEGLKELLAIHPSIEARLWKSGGVSFHPKAYLIETFEGEFLVVGSSNLSQSALTQGVEWNLTVEKNTDFFNEVADQFLEYFYHEHTVPLNVETLKSYEQEYKDYHQKYPDLARNWTDQEEIEHMLPREEQEEVLPASIVDPNEVYRTTIEPRFAQPEALDELDKTLEEGYRKAMVVMATGLGKTYLAAFFAQRFKRVLFVAHREEILFQAEKSFRHVMEDRSTGIYNGKHKDWERDTIFASVFTLSMQKHLNKFPPDYFDLIVVDEFHHAAASSYQRLLEHLQPTFLLGITATPDRNDHRDVYALCDGNVAYKIGFLEAIEQGWLSPFQYYGVYDDTDYSAIRWLGNRYDEEELLQVQLKEGQAQKILDAWKVHKQTRTLVFCSSIQQAEYLSGYFNQKGFKTVSLHSKQKKISREEAIKQLTEEKLDAIFTVDLFNEGVDIPSVDTLLFVRPTESLTVFTQQVGRGLRLVNGKEYCSIIDLIGNYRNADVKLSVFNQQPSSNKTPPIIPTVPASCMIDLDVRVVDLLKEMARKQQPRKQQLLQAYLDLKQELGRRPSYSDLHLKGRMAAKPYYDEWKSYHSFLHWAGELTTQEEEVFLTYEAWLKEVERTTMSKSYKMVLLLAMLEKGPDSWYEPIKASEVALFFHDFLTSREYRKRIDLSDKSSRKLWTYDQNKMEKLIETMPMTKWSGSSKGKISFESGVFDVGLSPSVEQRPVVFKMTKEIVAYRLMYYFQRRERK